jgi:hypothetical protein
LIRPTLKICSVVILLVVLQYRSIDKSFNNKFGEFIIDFVYDVTLTVISRALIKKYLFFQKKNTYNKQKSTKKRQKSTKKKACQHNKIHKTPFFIEHYYLFSAILIKNLARLLLNNIDFA